MLRLLRSEQIELGAKSESCLEGCWLETFSTGNVAEAAVSKFRPQKKFGLTGEGESQLGGIVARCPIIFSSIAVE